VVGDGGAENESVACDEAEGVVWALPESAAEELLTREALLAPLGVKGPVDVMVAEGAADDVLRGVGVDEPLFDVEEVGETVDETVGVLAAEGDERVLLVIEKEEDGLLEFELRGVSVARAERLTTADAEAPLLAEGVPEDERVGAEEGVDGPLGAAPTDWLEDGVADTHADEEGESEVMALIDADSEGDFELTAEGLWEGDGEDVRVPEVEEHAVGDALVVPVPEDDKVGEDEAVEVAVAAEEREPDADTPNEGEPVALALELTPGVTVTEEDSVEFEDAVPALNEGEVLADKLEVGETLEVGEVLAVAEGPADTLPEPDEEGLQPPLGEEEELAERLNVAVLETDDDALGERLGEGELLRERRAVAVVLTDGCAEIEALSELCVLGDEVALVEKLCFMEELAEVDVRGEGEGDALGVETVLALPEFVSVAHAVTEGESEGEADVVADVEREAVLEVHSVPDALPVGEMVGSIVALPVRAALGDAVADALTLETELPLAKAVPVAQVLGGGDAEGAPEAVADEENNAEVEGCDVPEGVALGGADSDTVPLGQWDTVGVMDGEAVPDPHALPLPDGVPVAHTLNAGDSE
jgi:hypothetical protein